jgi:hypothetical protein
MKYEFKSVWCFEKNRQKTFSNIMNNIILNIDKEYEIKKIYIKMKSKLKFVKRLYHFS